MTERVPIISLWACCVYCGQRLAEQESYEPFVLVREPWGEGEDYHGAQWAHLDCYDRTNRNALWHARLAANMPPKDRA